MRLTPWHKSGGLLLTLLAGWTGTAAGMETIPRILILLFLVILSEKTQSLLIICIYDFSLNIY